MTEEQAKQKAKEVVSAWRYSTPWFNLDDAERDIAAALREAAMPDRGPTTMPTRGQLIAAKWFNQFQTTGHSPKESELAADIDRERADVREKCIAAVHEAMKRWELAAIRNKVLDAIRKAVQP